MGTTIEILLPQDATPKWFLPKLLVNPKETIVILDDDESIHQVWKKRFNDIDDDFTFMNYYNPQDILNWNKDNLTADKYLSHRL